MKDLTPHEWINDSSELPREWVPYKWLTLGQTFGTVVKKPHGKPSFHIGVPGFRS